MLDLKYTRFVNDKTIFHMYHEGVMISVYCGTFARNHLVSCSLLDICFLHLYLTYYLRQWLLCSMYSCESTGDGARMGYKKLPVTNCSIITSEMKILLQCLAVNL